MATTIKKCKVCGQDYEYCHTLRPGVVRWQDVACCPEHARIYFAQVETARNPISEAVEEHIDTGSDAQTDVVQKPSVQKARKRKTVQSA
jgi:hypothetical protein